jgi:hypothetical protein
MSRKKKKFLAILAVCSAGTLLQTGFVPSGCAQWYLTTTLSAFDFCSVFNCSSGTYFDLCDPAIFMDCPVVSGP